MTEIIQIPWAAENYRGHYCDFNGRICFKSGYIAARHSPTELIEAWYYEHDDDDDAVPWDESPIPLSKYSVKAEDEYDVEADERAAEREAEVEEKRELRQLRRYFEHIREDWN